MLSAFTSLTQTFARSRLDSSQNNLQSAIQKLSSGLRINRASDDAARLKISQELSQQSKTLTAATKNAMSAISMAQTADGSLSEISNLLVRIKQLAVSGRDNALNQTQVKAISDEMEQLRREVNSIANRTTYNDRRLLTDELGSWVTVLNDEKLDGNWSDQYVDSDSVRVIINAEGDDLVRLNSTSGLTSVKGYNGATSDGAATNGSWTNGTAQEIGFNASWEDAKAVLRDLEFQRQKGGGEISVQVIPAAMYSYTDDSGRISYYEVVTDALTWTNARAAALSRSFSGLDGYLANITSAGEYNFIKDKVAATAWIGASDVGTEGTWKWMDGPEAGTTFWQGTSTGSAVNGQYSAWATGQPDASGDGANLWADQAYMWDDLADAATTPKYIVEYTGNVGFQSMIAWAPGNANGNATFQVGVNARDTTTTSAFRDVRIATNNRDTDSALIFETLATKIQNAFSSSSYRTSSDFASIANLADDVIAEVGYRRSELGALQNRLFSSLGNTFNQSTSLEKSSAGFLGTDFAGETARLTRLQIGQQAATAALAQANLMPNAILTLIL